MAWRWLPGGALGAVVLMAGYAEISLVAYTAVDSQLAVYVVLATATAVGLCRRAPALALALVWASGAVQALLHLPILGVQLALAAVAFGCARWGRTTTVWSALASLIGGSLLTGLLVRWGVLHLALGRTQLLSVIVARRGPTISLLTANLWATLALFAAALLGTPWLLGLVLRIAARAREQSHQAAADLLEERREREKAQEIATVREQQTRLARDVHDVVGHSLAVILAQAQSGEYLPSDDPAAPKQVLATIAKLARESLHDVRQVLTATHNDRTSEDLDQLMVNLRATGHSITASQTGVARPLPPEQATTAFRVLQEMLTNAIRHGRPGAPIVVVRTWAPDTLALQVSNSVEPNSVEELLAGYGLTGMRARVNAVGGQLNVQRAHGEFSVTAWIPVRG